eukprot:753776-Hanusia_phi.AAC.2
MKGSMQMQEEEEERWRRKRWRWWWMYLDGIDCDEACDLACVAQQGDVSRSSCFRLKAIHILNPPVGKCKLKLLNEQVSHSCPLALPPAPTSYPLILVQLLLALILVHL